MKFLKITLPILTVILALASEQALAKSRYHLFEGFLFQRVDGQDK